MVMPIKPAAFPIAELPAARIGKGDGLGSGASAISGGAAPSAPSATSGVDFSSKLREALNEANETQVKAQQAADDYASGKQNDLHGTMITMTEADVSLRLVSNVRNRVIEAYREVMRMGS
jgi:flagellar hook-basal body complex protein FliE